MTCPVLVIQAEQDDVTGPRNGEFIRQRVSSDRRELVLLKRSYHLVSADLERADVAEHLRRFCDSLAVPRTKRAGAARAGVEIGA